jgi:hypothetical protein
VEAKGLQDVEDPTLFRQAAHRWGEVVSLTHLPHSTPQKRLFISVSGTHFC